MNSRPVIEVRELELAFKHEGGVELRSMKDSGDIDTVLWASDSDPTFMDAFNKEFFDPGEDAEPVMDYLVSAGKITEDEADQLEIIEESLDPDEDDSEDYDEG